MTKREMLNMVEWRLKEINIQLANFGDVPVNNAEALVEEVREMAVTAHKHITQVLEDSNSAGLTWEVERERSQHD